MNSTATTAPHDFYDTGCRYVFRSVHTQHRHLVPGTLACLLIEDSYGAALRSETGWVDVLSCSDDGTYLGRFFTPVHDFPEIVVGDRVSFQLEQVLRAGGQRLALSA